MDKRRDASLESIASQLLKDVLQKSSSPNKNFVTATDLYRIGLIIYNLNQQQQDNNHQLQTVSINVQTAALAVMQGLPVNIRQGLFDDLQEALQQVISIHQQQQQEEDLTRALESFVGIWSLLLVVVSHNDDAGAKTRRRLAQQRWPNEVEISQCFIALYQKPHVPKACQLLILEFLSLVWLSPIQKDNSSNNNNSASSSSTHLEDFLTVLHSLQEQDTMWQDLILYHEQQQQQRSSSSWRQELVQSLTQNNDNDDATQRDYLASLLVYEKTPETNRSIYVMPSPAKPNSKGVVQMKNTKRDAMQERIDQVRAIIPNVGEGFVELALSLYQGDAERAISALLEPELPPGLQYVDRQLPRRKNPNAMTLNDEDAKVAKQITKKALQAEEERQRQEAAAIYYVSKTEEDNNTNKNVVHQYHDEYDDEYDDQWDADFAGTTAGADDGLYDRLDSRGGSGSGDYHAVLAYNRAMKQVEGEQSFWDEQRNTNRTIAAATKTTSNAEATDSGATSYRGPDKIKGGRVPGGRGGGGAAGGGGGGGGNKSAKGKKDSSDVQDLPAAGGKGQNQGKAGASATSNSDNKPSKPNQRHKANKLASRREQQKQSMTKRSGGM